MKRNWLKYMVMMLICLFVLTGCTKQEQDIKGKLDAELNYVEDLIFKIANKDAKGEYIEEEEFKWNYVKGDIQKINSVWNSMLLDLTEVNISSESLLQYSDNLNRLLLSVSNEDEIAMISELNGLYERIVGFKTLYSDDKNGVERDRIKSGCLLVYSLTNQEQYDNAKTQIDITIENYEKLMNNEDYAQQNRYDLNKVYVLLEEYKNSIELQNLDLIRMKYILVVEEL